MGSSWRASCATNATASAAAAASRPSVNGESQPARSVWISARVKQNRAPDASSAPTTSSWRACGLRDSRTHTAATIAPTSADRHVDPEDRRPVEEAQQHARDHRPHAEAEARERRPHADRPRAPLGLVGVRQDRQRRRRQQRRADALQRAEDDQHRVVRRQRAADREQGEQHEAGDEDALAPVAVAERAADQDQRRQRQHVGVRPSTRSRPGDTPSARWIDGSVTFTIVTSSWIMNCAKHAAASVQSCQRRVASSSWAAAGMGGARDGATPDTSTKHGAAERPTGRNWRGASRFAPRSERRAAR